MNPAMDTRRRSPRRPALAVAGILFGAFLANVIAGRIIVSQGNTQGTGIPDVIEFIVFLVAVIFFVVAILDRERAREGARDGKTDETTSADQAADANHGRIE